ncbi:MAG: hypothetical protein Q3X95_09315 [Duodenibacillus sp.]|nr:hypothetical protein [Duodenibacillus sp.]
MANLSFWGQVNSESMTASAPVVDDTEPGLCLPPHVYSKEIRVWAIGLFKKGAGYKRTSSVLGIKPSVVRDWARRWRKGLFTAEIPRNLYLYDDETIERVSALYRNGCRDIGRLSERTGVPSGVCRRIVARCEREKAVTIS